MPDWEDERDRLEAEVNRWHAEALRQQIEARRLGNRVHNLELMERTFLANIDRLAGIFPEANRKKILAWLDDCTLLRDARHPGRYAEADCERLRAALRQVAWMADASEPLSVKAAEVARAALGDEPAPKPPLCGYCGDRPSSLVPCPECDS